MQDFRNLKVWQKAHAVTLAIYKETRGFLLMRDSASRVNCVDHVHRSLQTLRKAALEAATLNLLVL